MTHTLNGHPENSVRWMRAADVPPHLGDAVVPTEAPDEAPIWGEQAPDPDALEAAVQRAQRAVELQSAPELAEAKSPADVAADLEAARALRELHREHEQERQVAALAEARETAVHERGMRRREREARERADASRRRAAEVTDTAGDLVRLDRARRWVPLLAGVPALGAIAAGAVNVGAELSRLFPHTPVIPWVVEPILTTLIVAIMLAQMVGMAPAVATARQALRDGYVLAEIVLFALTGALAVGLHYVDGPTPDRRATPDGALVWLVVPIGLALSMWLVPKLRADLTAKFVAAENRLREQARDEASPVASDLHRNKAGSTDRDTTVPTIPEPSRKGSFATHRATLQRLVGSGEIDPHTVSVNAVKSRLRCRPETAKTLLAEYRTGGEP